MSASHFASSSAAPGAHVSRQDEGQGGCDIGLLHKNANLEMIL
ncbi:hypothetical protein PC119_g19953 [Phytophthora cactorum]|uniref:Uncharacterized protein n=1 Tax=Phytophthora cactorum TaxID=29920 RepID=A0A8T1BQI4_9STRA|nr:hypothetical protein PC115_g18131 [Phytophthora cactorum]KAG2906742.1 hypothetical protein PC117_g20409 [Phytophthora cactorum]KAG2925507.1 hypothetical protein PC114_g4102 [Phytophthora cactorum]KAG2986306.1 hypothetical protein PC119_g19953 [Phytophthora cactorum]KAG3137497.1 hypothetical protein C6341_g20964 [Phytophthora cactorum]